MAEEIRIDLKSTADTSGVDAMGNAVAKIAGGAKGAADGISGVSKESKDMAQNLGRGVEVGNATTALMQNLGNASKGGAEGMFAAARAAASFGQVIKGVLAGAGPIGIAVAAIGLLVGALLTLKEAFKPAAESADEMRKRIEELNRAKLDDVTKQLAEIQRNAKDGQEALDKEVAAMDRLADAKLAQSKAEVRADTKLTPEQRDAKITELDRNNQDRKLKQDAAVLDRRALVDTSAAAQLAGEVADKEAALRDASEQIKEWSKLRAQEASLKEQSLNIPGEGLRSTESGHSAEWNRINDEFTGVQAARIAAEKKAATAIERIPGLQEELKKSQEAYSAVLDTAAKSTAAAAGERAIQGKLDPITTATRAAEDRATAADVAKKAKEAAEKKAEQQQRDAAEAAKAAAERNKLIEAKRAELIASDAAERQAQVGSITDPVERMRAEQGAKVQALIDARLAQGQQYAGARSDVAAQFGGDTSDFGANLRAFGGLAGGQGLSVDARLSAYAMGLGGGAPRAAIPDAAPFVSPLAQQPATGGTITRGGDSFSAGASGLKKLGEEVPKLNETMGKAADQKPVDLQPSVDAADRMLKAQQEQAAALTSMVTGHAEAFATIGSFAGNTAGAISTHTSQIAQLRAMIAQLAAQVAASRSKSPG